MEYEFEIGDGAVGGVVSDAERMRGGVVWPVQTHGCNVLAIDRGSMFNGEKVRDADGKELDLSDTDALVCLQKGIKVGVRTADCVPVVIYAPDIEAVAAIHAGWKGTLGGVVTATVEKLCELGAEPQRMRAFFGPNICGECYEVSRELADEFRAAGFGDCILGERNLDLEAVNRKRLVAAGVREENIEGKRYCTKATPGFPSWRRKPCQERLLTWIAMHELNEEYDNRQRNIEQGISPFGR